MTGRAAPTPGTLMEPTHPFDRALAVTLDRLDALLAQETAALRRASVAELKDFNNRKNQALLELSQVVGVTRGAPPSNYLRMRVTGLRDKLEANRRALKMHLDAVQDVAGMLADRMREDESDGTYTHGIRGQGRFR